MVASSRADPGSLGRLDVEIGRPAHASPSVAAGGVYRLCWCPAGVRQCSSSADFRTEAGSLVLAGPSEYIASLFPGQQAPSSGGPGGGRRSLPALRRHNALQWFRRLCGARRPQAVSVQPAIRRRRAPAGRPPLAAARRCPQMPADACRSAASPFRDPPPTRCPAAARLRLPPGGAPTAPADSPKTLAAARRTPASACRRLAPPIARSQPPVPPQPLPDRHLSPPAAACRLPESARVGSEAEGGGEDRLEDAGGEAAGGRRARSGAVPQGDPAASSLPVDLRPSRRQAARPLPPAIAADPPPLPTRRRPPAAACRPPLAAARRPRPAHRRPPACGEGGASAPALGAGLSPGRNGRSRPGHRRKRWRGSARWAPG